MRRHRGGLTAHDNRAEPRYSRPGAPIHPEQPRGTKATPTRLTIAGNRKFESTSLQQGVRCEPVCHEPRSSVREAAGTVSLDTSKLYTRAVLPPAILACSSSGTPARISARIFRDCGNVDSLCG